MELHFHSSVTEDANYFFAPRHLSEQYFTESHTFSHFLRQVNGLPQVTHVLVGKLCFATPRILTLGAKAAAPAIYTHHLACNPARLWREKKCRKRCHIISFAQTLQGMHCRHTLRHGIILGDE